MTKLILGNQVVTMLALSYLIRELTAFPDTARDGLQSHISATEEALRVWDVGEARAPEIR